MASITNEVVFYHPLFPIYVRPEGSTSVHVVVPTKLYSETQLSKDNPSHCVLKVYSFTKDRPEQKGVAEKEFDAHKIVSTFAVPLLTRSSSHSLLLDPLRPFFSFSFTFYFII